MKDRWSNVRVEYGPPTVKTDLTGYPDPLKRRAKTEQTTNEGHDGDTGPEGADSPQLDATKPMIRRKTRCGES